jgi:hypothetical protein
MIRIRDEHPGSYSESLEKIFGLKILYLCSGSRSWIRNLVDPGYGMEKFGSGINIPDPQHCGKELQCLILDSHLSIWALTLSSSVMEDGRGG